MASYHKTSILIFIPVIISSVVMILYGKPHSFDLKMEAAGPSGTLRWQCGLRSLRKISRTCYHTGLSSILSELEWRFPSKLEYMRSHPEERGLNIHLWENLKAHTFKIFNFSNIIVKRWGLPLESKWVCF
jgi:hypothetical protein